MKIYISGKITGSPEKEVSAKFEQAEKMLTEKGYKVINPNTIEISIKKFSGSWNDYMTNDIRALLHCDAIYMLKDWGQSKGARIEYMIAKEIGLNIIFE